MALVSYVDILEVVGELDDFRNKLIEGENIANSNGITDAKIARRDSSGWEISTKCKVQIGDTSLEPLSVSICSTTQPRNLKCTCSCNGQVSAKCKHVIATLIYLHRNNVPASCNGADVPGNQEKTDASPAPLKTQHDKTKKNRRKSGEPQSKRAKLVELISKEGDVSESVRAGGRGPERLEKTSELKGKSVTPEDTSQANINNAAEGPAHVCDKSVNEASSEKQESKEQTVVKRRVPRMKLKPSSLVKKNKFDRVEAEKTAGSDDNSNAGRTDQKPKEDEHKLVSRSVGTKKHTCDVCGKTFDRKSNMVTHRRTHNTDKSFTCCNCGRSFSRKNLIDKHFEMSEACKLDCEEHRAKAENMEEKRTCKECGKIFLCKRSLDLHQRVHQKNRTPRDAPAGRTAVDDDQSGGQFSCDICDKKFSKSANLTEHKRSHEKRKTGFQCTKCGKCFKGKRSFAAHEHCEQEVSKPVKKRAKRRVVVKCDVCGKEFSNRMHHEEHMRSHTGERPFQCVECGKGFASKRSLRNHSHEGPAARDRPYLCSQCPAKFATAFMLKTHSRTHTDEKPWVCSECGKAYRSQHVLVDHQNQHKGIKAHTCKECGKKFTWRTSLWAHAREHSRDKPFECVQCGAMFAEQLELKEHWQEHSNDKPYQCSECGLGFLQEEDRDKHMETHSKEAAFACSVCSERFARADQLAQHRHIHKEPRTSLCSHCGKTFSNKGHLKVHMMIHSGEKPFECETCHKRFYTRSLLRKHTVFHSNERPFECCHCGDRFPTQGILQSHLRTHTGEKPFTCQSCGKSFTQSTYLKRHALTHSGERPHPCKVCEAAFISRYDLKIHMRVHTGEKPFTCQDCGESFYEKSALTAHRRIHTGELPFRCDQCDKGFTSSNHIKKHYSRIHPDIKPFPCDACLERFSMCEELRKHRRRVHFLSNPSRVDQGSVVITPNDSILARALTRNPASGQRKDALNQLIEDSEILQEEPTISEEIPEYQVPVVPIVCLEETHARIAMKLENVDCDQLRVYHTQEVHFEADTSFPPAIPAIAPQSIHTVDVRKDTSAVTSQDTRGDSHEIDGHEAKLLVVASSSL